MEPNKNKHKKTKQKQTKYENTFSTFICGVSNKMSEESDDSDSSDNSSRQKILIAAGMSLCIIQFAFFVSMIKQFIELDFGGGLIFMFLAYTSAFIYRNLENRGAIPVADEN